VREKYLGQECKRSQLIQGNSHKIFLQPSNVISRSGKNHENFLKFQKKSKRVIKKVETVFKAKKGN